MPAPLFAVSYEAAPYIAAAIALPIFGLMLVGLVFVIRDTVRGKGRWGVNTKAAVCSECGTPAPVVRVPRNRQQMLWGGWTCEECGLELDKWGQPVADQPKKKRKQRDDDD